MNVKHRVSKCPSGIDGYYIYRGVTIKRHDRNRGYWGYWTACVGSIMKDTYKKISTSKRADLLKLIDEYLNSDNSTGG